MTFTEKLIIAILVAIVGAFIAIIFSLLNPFGVMPNYSDGQRTGDIYKISKKGVFWKSWEGEMYLGGYHSTGGKNPTIETDKFYFSIPESEETVKADIIKKLQECSETRNECTVKYREWLIGPWWVGSSHIVEDVISK